MARGRLSGPSQTASKRWLDARRHRDSADLLEQAKLVEEAPAPDELPARNAVDVDPSGGHLLPGRRHPHQFALVCARPRPTCDDGVTFGDLLVDTDAQVRERRSVHQDELAEPL